MCASVVYKRTFEDDQQEFTELACAWLHEDGKRMFLFKLCCTNTS